MPEASEDPGAPGDQDLKKINKHQKFLDLRNPQQIKNCQVDQEIQDLHEIQELQSALGAPGDQNLQDIKRLYYLKNLQNPNRVQNRQEHQEIVRFQNLK